MLEINNSFDVFIHTLSVDEVCQVRVNSRNFGFTQTWKNDIYFSLTKVNTCPKKKRNVTPLFWVDLTLEWYENDMVFCVFIVIIFRSNGKKRHLDANDFRHCCGNFFGNCNSESYLITTMFKVPSQQLRSTLAIAFCNIPYSSIFYGHGLTCVLTLSSRLW